MTETIHTNPAHPYLDAAFDIGIHLANTALWDGNRCNWVGSAVEAVNGSYQLVEKTFGYDLYNGTSGIALFLSLLLEQKPDAVLKKTLEGTINQVLGREDWPGTNNNYGYYGGRLGIAAALITAGEKMNCQDWVRQGWEKLITLCRQPVQEFEVDVIAGAAGAIPVLINLYHRSRLPELGEAITKCGNFLIEKAIKTESYWSWYSIDSGKGMTGYSHGAAGMATALLELYKLTGNATYYTGAMMGYNYERVNYSPQMQNWPDFRELQPTAQPGATAPLNYGEVWCHGAPGIALSRLRAWQITQDPSFKQEAEIALATTHRNVYNLVSNQTTPSNFSICHGLAGNADILLEGGKVLNNPLYLQVANEIGNYGLDKYQKKGITWPSGVNDPTGATAGMAETPGLMLGLAGTGYFYLRLAFPDKIKSLLLL